MRKKNNLVLSWSIIIMLIVVVPSVSSQREFLSSSIPNIDQVIINSQNWQDIYYGLLYAKLIGVPGDYLIVQDAAVPFTQSLNSNLKNILLIEPSNSPQFQGLQRLLEREGFTILDLPGSGSIGLRLAQTITPKAIIISDERYPYNAVTLAPYAITKNEFVLFADATTVDELDAYLGQKNIPITLFGIIDSAVSLRLEKYSPTSINEGGKFENNIFIANEFLKLNPGQQVIVTNGEFLEIGLIDDFNANVFVGQSNIPKVVEDFFVENEIIVSVLVGNYLSDQMSVLKDDLKKKYDQDMQVFVRFAKTPRQLQGQFSEPQALEFFPLPINLPALEITEFTYNRLSKNLEVTYSNPSLIQTFFTSSIILQLSDGSATTVGDAFPQSIVSGQSRTLLYALDTIPLSAQGLFLFGDYPISQEFSLSQSFSEIAIIDIADDSQLQIDAIVYDKWDKAFFITVSNPSNVSTYAQLELVDVIIDGLPQTIGTKDVFLVPAGESKTVFIRAALQNLDVVENERVLLRGNYGQRKLVLFKQIEQELSLEIRLIKQAYVIAAIAVVIILLLVFMAQFTKEKRYVCDRCGDRKSSRKKPGRHNCGGKYQKS